jgi:hypothetical protein
MFAGFASMSDLVNERAVVWKVDECPSQGVCQGNTRTARGAVSTDFNLGFRWISDHFLSFGLGFVNTNYPSQNPGTIQIILYQGVPIEKIDKFTEVAVVWRSDEFGILDLPPADSCIVKDSYENKPCWRRLDAGEKAWQAAAKQRAQEAQAKVMTEAELGKFIEEKAKAYGVVISSMNPNQGLEYKKFRRSPGDYLGQIVLMRGDLKDFRRSYQPEVWNSLPYQYAFVSSKPEQKSFHLLGLTPLSSVHKLRADDFLIIGTVAPGFTGSRYLVGWDTDAGINVYMICGIISDAPSKRAEVSCDSLEKPSRLEEGSTLMPPVPVPVPTPTPPQAQQPSGISELQLFTTLLSEMINYVLAGDFTEQGHRLANQGICGFTITYLTLHGRPLTPSIADFCRYAQRRAEEPIPTTPAQEEILKRVKKLLQEAAQK